MVGMYMYGNNILERNVEFETDYWCNRFAA